MALAAPRARRSLIGLSQRSKSTRRRVLAVMLALTAPVSLVAVGFVAPTVAHAAPPPNPSDAQLAAQAAVKAQAAKDVGRLSGLIAAADTQIEHLDGLAELAKERWLKAMSDLAHAKAAATTAAADVTKAQKAVDAAQANYRQFVVAAYINRDGDSSGVFTSSDPNALLSRGDMLRYTSARQINALGDMNRATVEKSNADASARVAVANQTTATDQATQAQRVAVAAVDSAHRQRAALAASKIQYQAQLQTAQMALLGLQNQRAKYNAWVAEQARIAAEKARQAAIAAEQARQAELAREQAEAAAQGNNSGGSSGSGSGPVVQYAGGGAWTPAQGQAAANRALRWLGTPYSFAAGNANGPTWGACVTDDAGWNDCHVFGFDCSGLALYAWAPYIGTMDHFAATQYYQAGSVHPSVDQLLPGDLVFWSSDGSEPAIHHVAIYIGGGQVVQAPQSGDVVKISNLWMDEYYGATRPNT